MGRMEGGGAGTIEALPTVGGRIRSPRAPEVQAPGVVRVEDVILARLSRGATTEIRLARTSYRGATLLALRVWWLDRTGTWRPTRKGLALRLEELELVQAALAHVAAGTTPPSSTSAATPPAAPAAPEATS